MFPVYHGTSWKPSDSPVAQALGSPAEISLEIIRETAEDVGWLKEQRSVPGPRHPKFSCHSTNFECEDIHYLWLSLMTLHEFGKPKKEIQMSYLISSHQKDSHSNLKNWHQI